MATIVLAAAGAAVGGVIGGGIAGLPAVAIGRALGAVAGRAIDDRLLGVGSDAVDVGRVDRFRLSHSGEGAAVPKVFGRMRIGGQVIWASDFLESTTTTGGGGKGRPKPPKTTHYSYSVSLAVAVCAGEISGIGRVWADGEEVSPEDLNMQIYTGSADQLPDPTIEAIEGAGDVPAYRGTAYVVMDGLELAQFGNRVPQFSFEVLRAEQNRFLGPAEASGLGQVIPGVAMMPGTGEYALATEPVTIEESKGRMRVTNVNSPSGKTDFVTSLEQLRTEIPACEATSLVVSWFGDDLRCGSCQIQPRVEQTEADGREMAWRVAGLNRDEATRLTEEDGRPIYGGTPADTSVIQAIRHMKAVGQRVMFYPFILMEQTEGNSLPDPWTGDESQPALPWRGRITLSKAPGREGSPDQTASADDEVVAFFGTASADDFDISESGVSYTGPQEWGLRRFILHNAALCAAAGGVDSFCISSEMRGLTQIRGANGFPAVNALQVLAAEVRRILGPDTKIGYAADWSEYFGYQPPEGAGAFLFHLDPLWADENIDFVGIDNYMPVSDWRDGSDHLDRQAGWKSIYDPAYLQSNIEGGEGYDWYYLSGGAAEAQIRTPIEDAAHDEPWIWRFKDLKNWWGQPHHDREGGVRNDTPTAWVPGSKPIYFTELGCAAIDKGTNQPNKFLDEKSSESALPNYSNGYRDDFIQMQYLKSVIGYWRNEENNPASDLYEGRMIDMDRAFIWAWDARPFPFFPNNGALWSDGENYLRGHWVNGRAGANSLAAVVAELCTAAGLEHFDVSDLQGVVQGYVLDAVTDARAALQPLMIRYGFDAIERNGILKFRMRTGLDAEEIQKDQIVETRETEALIDLSRDADAEVSGRVRVRCVEAAADFDPLSEEAILPEDATHAVQSSELTLAMSRGEARNVAQRWLAESRVARETAKFGLPPSLLHLGAGDIVELPQPMGNKALYRIDRVEQSDFQLVEAVRIEPGVYDPVDTFSKTAQVRKFNAPVPVLPVFMDLPLLTGDEVPHAPFIAVTGDPWPGSVAIYSSGSDAGYGLNQIVAARSTIGFTETELKAAPPGLWDEGDDLQVRLVSGRLESRMRGDVLNGANLMAIGDGTSGNWELLQFRRAELIGPDTYLLSGRLRGQQGTDGLGAGIWPAGSTVVLLDGTETQLELTSQQRRIARHYRIGPAQRGYDDPSYVHKIEAFDGNGLRPYSPCHLQAHMRNDGSVDVRWTRRTRIEGDSWDLPEVALGEESEIYQVRVTDGANLLREAQVQVPEWHYSSDERAADSAAGLVTIEVAQISARFGAGSARSLTLDALT